MKRVLMTCTVAQDTKDRFNKYCEEQGEPKGWVLTELMEYYLDRKLHRFEGKMFTREELNAYFRARGLVLVGGRYVSAES